MNFLKKIPFFSGLILIFSIASSCEGTNLAKSHKRQLHDKNKNKNNCRSITRSSGSSVFDIDFNFTSATASTVLNPNVIPMNQNAWVGPKQYILMTYGIIKSFDKATGKPDGILNIDAASFFGVSAQDVRINYSRFADKWILTCQNEDLNTNQVKDLVIAFSDTGIITESTVWTIKFIPNEQLIPNIIPLGSGDLDYNQSATDANAVYITVDTFEGGFGPFQGSALVIIPNTSLVTRNPFSYTVIPNVLDFPATEFTPPADNFDPVSQFGYIINCFLGNGINNTTFNFFRILDPGSNNPTLGPLVEIPVESYADVSFSPHKGNLYGPPGFLQTEFGIIMAPHVRNKQLYVVKCTQMNQSGVGDITGDRIGLQFYQFDLTGDPTGQGLGTETPSTVPVIIQFGTIFDSALTNPKFYYIPSIMTNKKNELLICSTVSGANDFINVIYANRLASDPAGQLRGPFYATNNSFVYNYGPLTFNSADAQRWGDEGSLSPDPINDLDIWLTNEFVPQDNIWGVYSAKLSPTV